MKQTKVILITLDTKTWSATKTDKQVTKEVLAERGADRDAGRFTKRLIDKDFILTINKIQGQARRELYSISLPWGDNNARLINTTNFTEFQQVFDTIKVEFDAAVDSFVERYSDLVAEAEVNLGSMFDPADYPDEATVRAKFALGYSTMLVDLVSEDTTGTYDTIEASIQQQAAESAQRAASDAARAALARMYDAVKGVVDRVRDYDAGTLTRLYEGPFRAIEETAKAVEVLGSTGDTEVVEMAQRIKSLLGEIVPADVKRSSATRQQVVTTGDALLADLSSFMGEV